MVYKLIVNEGTFSQSMVSTAVDWYYNGLGLPKNYFRLHSPHLIAKHISAFMSSKLYVKDSGKPLSYREEEENYALYFVDANSTSTVLDVERSIEEKFLMEGYIHAKSTPIRRESGVSVKCYLSRGNIEPGGSSKLSIYLVSRDEYVNPNSSEHESDIRKIATGAFLRDVDENTRDSCQRGITAGLSTVAVVVQRELTEMTGCQTIFVTYKRGTTHSYFSTLSVLMRNNYITCFSKLVREFSNGYNQYIFYLNGTEENIMKFQEQANLLYIIPRTSLFPLLEEYRFSAEEVVYAYAAWKFTYHFLNKSSEEFTQLWENLKDNETHRNRLIRLKQTIRNEAATESRVLQVVLTYPELVKEFYQDFRKHFEPRKDGTLPEKPDSLNKTLFSKVERTVPGLLDTQILQNFCLFNQHIIKTNFYKSEKSALSIQLNPGFVPNEFPRVPYSIIMFLGSEFRGFHVRFEAISRGGIRLIKSPNPHHFIKNAENVFSENYNLAYTQQRKNKDIPEGGSKGTVLLAQNHQHKSEAAFKKYIDSMLDLLLVTPTHKDAEIVDHLGSEDIIFCGPDEGTAGMMGWAALHAKKRGYRYWSSFTTGKSPTLGGIPHDVYGMTTRGIHQFVLGVMAKKGIKEESVFKVQTGGPDGDLGSNEILISKDKTKAVADGSGVLYDPLGLDRTELTRLAKTKQMVEKFDRKKLSPGGFLVLLNDKDCVLPDGNKIENGMNFRNTFHLTPYASCDFFVPCGGRPESLTIHNVSKVFINGVPIFKNIVEGANLFLTQEARLVLEAAGVPVLKDASANKGGVTSSSLEVLAALCFTNEEHEKYMCVKGDVVPKFYQDYVVEVQQIIEQNARLEFECVWNENQKTKVPMSTITDKLSEKINQLNEIISKSNLWSNGNIKQKILKLCFPKVLQDLLGLEEIVKRLPESYISATLSAHLASRYIYEFGLNPGEFSFFDFMQRYS
uniref:Glutamate/phenylalanine/leucine/valine/L-tryptophan dehydrogenase C-terminal domain-containing protein n=1 Tax=Arcella intermedia TaxID=1963864 RepID=A0A6B2KXK1_9EUKA